MNSSRAGSLGCNVERHIVLLVLLGGVSCSGSDGGGTSVNTGGATAAGGATVGVGGAATGGVLSMGGAGMQGGTNSAGGAAVTGGVSSTIGTSSNAGGTAGTGGSKATGGIAATGGRLTTGGAPTSGGTNGTGGTSSTGTNTGGSLNTGGSKTTVGTTSTGGTKTTGGNSSAGGTTTTGGSKATSGTTSTGGSNSTGGNSAIGGGTGVPACATNQSSACTGTNPIECHFGGNPGDYEVTVDLGGTTAGDMYIEAESYRRMLGQTTTAAGQTKRFSFSVNVRQPEGQPVQAVPAGTPGLDVYIRGNAPRLSAICYQVKKSVPKFWIAGDSTVCDQDGTDYAGWGQHLPQFFNIPVSVANYADSGESSGSFLGNGQLWGAIKAGWTAGDWVIIQLGHNDKTGDAAGFQANMTAYVTQAKAAGVHPILCTPTARIGYTLAQEHVWGNANLPQIIRDIGTSQNVPVIDLTVTTWNWQQTLGSGWPAYYALGTDHTHTNPAGAEVIAGFVRDAIRAQNIGLSPYLR